MRRSSWAGPADKLGGDEMERIKGEIGALAQSEEDVLTYAMFPEIARSYLQERSAGTAKARDPVAPAGKKGSRQATHLLQAARAQANSR